MSEQSNFDWMLGAIRGAMSRERLDCLAHDIAADAEEGADYTIDPENVRKLRAAWAKRATEIKAKK